MANLLLALTALFTLLAAVAAALVAPELGLFIILTLAAPTLLLHHEEVKKQVNRQQAQYRDLLFYADLDAPFAS